MKESDIHYYREQAYKKLQDVKIPITDFENIEITDFGKGNFKQEGLALYIKVDEEEYASKWLVVWPGQQCPNHYHKIIKETFICMNGSVKITTGDYDTVLSPGEMITLLPNTWHSFISKEGCIIEEVTTKQYPDDSYFEDPAIERYVRID